MGTIKKGILGGFSGKVGTVIGGNWKGIDYMRGKAASISNPKTEAQLDQRARFGAALAFLQPMTPFIRVGFKNFAIKMTAFNSAMSYNLNNALIGAYPDYSIDYANALVSRGSLAGALNPAAESANQGEVTFGWDDNSVEGNARPTDLAMLLVLNPIKKEAVYITNGAARTEGSQTLSVPASYSGDAVECYIAFIGLNGSISSSKYAGEVVVSVPR
jgi:hypothetical protein